MKKQQNNIDFNKYKIDPDRELMQWEKWITVRKCETKRLGMYLERPPADLAMNLLEKQREDKERKEVLEHAQIEIKPEIRGGPWEQPERLHQRCYCEPAYEVHRKPAELGAPPVIERIGVPHYIKVKEKGLLGNPERKECNQLNSDYMKYRDKRENELKKEITKIDPFKPDMRELIVKGEKIIPYVNKNKPPVPVIAIDVGVAPVEIMDSIYAIKINNTIIFKEIPGQDLSYIKHLMAQPGHEDCTSWSYYFKVPIKKVGRSKLFLQNLGTVALRYCWRKIKTTLNFIPEVAEKQVFFFNKNEDVISPGERKYLSFTFVSDKPSIYSEIWAINFCNIWFFDNLSDRLVIKLYADSTENIERIKRKTDILKTRIDRKATYIVIKRLIKDVVEKSMSIEPHIYSYKKLFLEAEMFRMKNPVCFYHQTEVLKMKDLYIEMKPKETWDLSIATWRRAMMDKEYEERMKYFQILKVSHTDLLKPWNEGENLKMQKYRAMKWLIGQLADKFDKEYNRVLQLHLPNPESQVYSTGVSTQRIASSDIDPMTRQIIHNVFYVLISEHVAVTVEAIAGVLSSLDLNKWLQFDFCRW